MDYSYSEFYFLNLKLDIFTNPVSKLISAIITAAITLFFISSFDLDFLTDLMICWIAAGLMFLILSWIAFFKNNPVDLKKYSGYFDKTHILVFFFLILASSLSLVAIIFLLKYDEDWKLPVSVVTAIYFTGVVISWLVQQTIFTNHYAHMYYANDNSGKILDFPDTKEPDYLDFAYFGFTIGMTFQVSDVVIRSKQLRKIVLFHSILSFGFNLIILSLSINAVMQI